MNRNNAKICLAPSLVIVMFGVNRNLSTTYHNLDQQVLKPLRSRGVRYALTWAFSETSALSNPRSKEIGAEPEFGSARLLSALQGSYINQAYIDHLTSDLFIEACRHGDPWEDDFHSICNHIRYLYTLKIASIQAFVMAPRCKWFLFLRPDLIFSDALDVESLISSYSSSDKELAITPAWHRWDGTNDRICLATRQAAEVYGLRFERADEYLSIEAKPLHAEVFLQWCLDQRNDVCQLPIINSRAHRIRCNESPQLIPELDATLSAILSAQKALLGTARRWASVKMKSVYNNARSRLLRPL